MRHGFAEVVVGRPHAVVQAPGRQRDRMLHAGAPLRRDDAVDLRHGRRVSGHFAILRCMLPVPSFLFLFLLWFGFQNMYDVPY